MYQKTIPDSSYRILLIAVSCAVLSSCSDKTSSGIDSMKIIDQTITEDFFEPFEQEGMCFSAKSGFYENEFYLDISADEGKTVYYTLDGNLPSIESEKYTQPIHIYDRSSDPDVLSAYTDIAQPADDVERELPKSPVDKATVVRAIAVDESGNQSEVVSNTYFVSFNDKAGYYNDVKIVSLITDEKNLFDYDNGIYMLGREYDEWLNGDDYDSTVPEWFMPANYTQKGREWEREANIQFFENGELELSQNIGIRIHGGATRSYTQKSFNIYARKDYGLSKLEYDLFSGSVNSEISNSSITEFDSFMLRNGGNDAMYTRFRDKLIQSLVSDRQFLTQGMVPCILFINGEYWGQYEITEKMDAAFIKSHFGIPKKDVCIIKKDELDEGDEATYDEWEKLHEWIKSTDFSDDSAYDELCQKVDMQSFMDYVSTELYIDNCDWGKSNSAMWRAQTVDAENMYADGRWRYIMFDTEYSSGIYGQSQPINDSFEKFMDKDSFTADLFNAALKNKSFRKEFYETFTEISETSFSDERVNTRIDELSESYCDMTVDTYNRFWRSSFGGNNARFNYSDSVQELRGFFSNRKKYITDYLKQYVIIEN
ncbi:MAG: CotH kinase family protein [Ruminococcus sp.]|nr:CotH kinase family protein [Ruminococcus sp.]